MVCRCTKCKILDRDIIFKKITDSWKNHQNGESIIPMAQWCQDHHVDI